MKKITVLLCFFLAFSCLNNSPINKIPDQFDYGTVKNGVYKNGFFDMIIPFNDTWNVKSRAEFEALTEEGVEMILGDNDDVRQNIETAKITTANLFAVFKYTEADAIANEAVFNPSFLLIAENLNGVNEIKSATDYLDFSKKMLESSLMDYEFAEDYESKTIDNVKFDVLKVKMEYAGLTIKQEIFATIKNNFSLFFTISYINDINKEALYKIVENIKFDTLKKGKPKKL